MPKFIINASVDLRIDDCKHKLQSLGLEQHQIIYDRIHFCITGKECCIEEFMKRVRKGEK